MLTALVDPLVLADVAVFVVRSDRVATVQADTSEGAFGYFVGVTTAFWMWNYTLDFDRHPQWCRCSAEHMFAHRGELTS